MLQNRIKGDKQAEKAGVEALFRRKGRQSNFYGIITTAHDDRGDERFNPITGE